jgi:hypothetical protein
MTHSMLRGSSASAHQTPSRLGSPGTFVPDRSREYPTEGPDVYGALPEDLAPLAAGDHADGIADYRIWPNGERRGSRQRMTKLFITCGAACG